MRGLMGRVACCGCVVAAAASTASGTAVTPGGSPAPALRPKVSKHIPYRTSRVYDTYSWFLPVGASDNIIV